MQVLEQTDGDTIADLTSVQALHDLLNKISRADMLECRERTYSQALASSALLRQAAIALIHFGVFFTANAFLDANLFGRKIEYSGIVGCAVDDDLA